MLNEGLPVITYDDGSSRRIDYYKDIDEEAIRMAKLIDDLLLLTTSQAQKRSLNKETFDTEAFLIDLYEAYSLVAMKKELELKLDLPTDTLQPVFADKLRLRQAITIMLDNAISYTQPHNSIILQAFQMKQQLIIKIIDHGIGIPDDKKPFIFDNFYRTDPSRIDKNHFGLGLSIAKELISLHSGTITVSDTSGGGTTFTVEIPIE
jgi:signal transduction histidine kinase